VRYSGAVATLSGIVAAPHHLAASVGADVLRHGGNAFDAAVAVSLAIGITQPYHSGIGGGCNITFLTAKGEAAHINARGPAPQQLTRELFLGADGTPTYDLVKAGGLAVTVPSLIAGLTTLHQGRGNLPWAKVCEAIVPLAADGFTADFRLASVYERSETRDKVARYAQESVFATPVHEGQKITQAQLAKTLNVLAQDPRSLYEGDIAKKLVTAVQRNGGVLSLDDLSQYRPEVTTLREGSYRGWQVLAPGLPTIGSLQTLLALRVLDRLSLDLALNSVRHQHLVAEVVKATYVERAKAESDDAVSALIDDIIVKRLAASIDLEQAREVSFQDNQTDESCTSHFCVADAEGNVVSQTQTIRSHFGSGIVDPETGVVLNDSVGDFSLQPGEVTTQGIRYAGNYNLLTPGAEPASSQSPLIAVHPSGDVIAVGAAGGPRIVSAALHALVNQVAFGLSPQIAVALPRAHSHGSATYVESEDAVADRLRALGHKVKTFAPAGITQTIRRRDGRWEGGADPRGPGGVAVVVEAEDGDKTVRKYGYDY